MKRALGFILSIGGLIAFVYTLTNYLNETASFGFLGTDIVVSKGDVTPVLISGGVLLVGIIIIWATRKN